MALVGLYGQPFIDLAPHIDLSVLPRLHEEICLALTAVEVGYTGGSHRSMGIVPASYASESHADYGEVIRAMSDDAFVVFASLGDEPHAIDLKQRKRTEFGEERDVPLSRRQMLYLEYRYGVYFPWAVYLELMPNDRWEDKSDPAGKHFSRDALLHFPRTVNFIRSLPLQHVGSCKLLGLRANDFGTVHRDGDPRVKRTADHFITFCPGGNKRLFLWDEEAKHKSYAPASGYWFNDSDYHGVESAPFFRYSIRVDGTFRPEFLTSLRAAYSVPRTMEHPDTAL